MNNNVKFSIIIPLYNKERMILRTLYSVLTQTYENFEIIIIDDGSTDKSVELISKKCADDRIHLIRQKNSGVSSARNRGIESATGHYIAFLDADDEWMPYYLENVVMAIEKYPDAALYSTPGFHRDLKTGCGLNALLRKYQNKIEIVDIFKCAKLCAQTSGVVLNKRWLDTAISKFPSKGFPVDLKYEEDVVCVNSMAFLSSCVYIGYTQSIKNNNVEGQLTGYTSSEDYRARILDNSIKCLSYLVKNFIISGTVSPSFKSHIRFEFRKNIIMLAQHCSYNDIKMFCNEITKDHYLFDLCKVDVLICKIIKQKVILKNIFKILRGKMYFRKHFIYKEI